MFIIKVAEEVEVDCRGELDKSSYSSDTFPQLNLIPDFHLLSSHYEQTGSDCSTEKKYSAWVFLNNFFFLVVK